jgi:tetratricopeptide (TPR) repeat protein
MNFMHKLYNALLSGRHAGKAIKLTKRGQYEDALMHYKLALFHESKSGTGRNPTTLECLARAYARLGNLKEALAAAEESYDLYKRLNSKNNLIVESKTRVEQFITALKSENMDSINKMLKV